jgi:hypothetical protein
VRRRRGLQAGCGEERAGKVDRADRARLVAALADAAGVPTVTRAVDRAHRRRGALAAGWPPVRWVRRLRPDPLRRLRLDAGELAAQATSLPPATPVQRAQVSAASRALAASAAGGLQPPWPALLREAALRHEDRVGDRLDEAIGATPDAPGAMRDRLDAAVAGTPLRLREPRWWRVAGLLQRLLLAVVAIGAVWLVAIAALGYLQLDDAVPTPDAAHVPLPTLLLAGGLLAGALLAFVARVVNGFGARRRARRVDRELRSRMEEVAGELVIGPVDAELDARERLCRAVRAAAQL